MSWYEINLNSQQIITYSIKTALIKMPNNSKYKNFKFWFPIKLLKTKGKHYVMTFNDYFVFTIFKTSSKPPFKIIEVDEIDAQEMTNIFQEINNTFNSCDFETHKPELLEVKEVEVLEELKDE